jgi:hypothetical protein
VVTQCVVYSISHGVAVILSYASGSFRIVNVQRGGG